MLAELLSKDEGELINIVNSFAVRCQGVTRTAAGSSHLYPALKSEEPGPS